MLEKFPGEEHLLARKCPECGGILVQRDPRLVKPLGWECFTCGELVLTGVFVTELGGTDQ